MLQETDDIKIYYDSEIDVNFMEIKNCRQKDAGTYQVTASNEFGTETAPVTLIITQNPEDVVDYKTNLKNRNHDRLNAEDQGPDWGKLKKGTALLKDGEGEGEKIKLRHVEREKKKAEDVTKDVREPVRKNL